MNKHRCELTRAALLISVVAGVGIERSGIESASSRTYGKYTEFWKDDFTSKAFIPRKDDQWIFYQSRLKWSAEKVHTFLSSLSVGEEEGADDLVQRLCDMMKRKKDVPIIASNMIYEACTFFPDEFEAFIQEENRKWESIAEMGFVNKNASVEGYFGRIKWAATTIAGLSRSPECYNRRKHLLMGKEWGRQQYDHVSNPSTAGLRHRGCPPDAPSCRRSRRSPQKKNFSGSFNEVQSLAFGMHEQQGLVDL